MVFHFYFLQSKPGPMQESMQVFVEEIKMKSVQNILLDIGMHIYKFVMHYSAI